MEAATFNGLGIAPDILKELNKKGFSVPTPIQLQSIPPAIEGKDVIGIAQTGTGKTLAFAIPIIQKLISSPSNGLIVLPTRELAIQVNESLEKIGRSLGLRTAIIIGGDNMNRQIRQIKSNPHIIIATPGRLIDHIQRRTVSLHKISILVLDEADRMLDMGFEKEIKKILVEIPRERQIMLFSATMPPKIMDIAKIHMQLPIRIEVAPAGSVTKNVTHEIFFLKQTSKIALLDTILKKHIGSTLIFSRTKFGAKKIAAQIRNMGHTASEIHSDRSLRQRLTALSGFKTGKYRVLVATDIAARGIDVTNIELVINYDLPEAPEDYVHRIGRTGRADSHGHAISFATPNQKFTIKMIERLIKKQLPVSKVPVLSQDSYSDKEAKPNNTENRRSFHQGKGAHSNANSPKNSYGRADYLGHSSSDRRLSSGQNSNSRNNFQTDYKGKRSRPDSRLSNKTN
ncbi:DEAD/DEAH box helicase [Patescibacteria group bacterium]|nr:DEAD/DEAH box helicase [Patescibacteria group bacterium]